MFHQSILDFIKNPGYDLKLNKRRDFPNESKLNSDDQIERHWRSIVEDRFRAGTRNQFPESVSPENWDSIPF